MFIRIGQKILRKKNHKVDDASDTAAQMAM